MEDIKQASILRRFIGSIPIVGPALGIFVEHTEMGISQYGAFLGLLRGALIGLTIAAALIAVSEAAIAVFDVGRFWINVNVTSKYQAAIGKEASRKAAEELNRPYDERHKQSPTATPAAEPTNTCPAEGPIKPCFWSKLGKYEKLHYILGVQDAVSGDHALWTELFRKDWSFGDHIERLDKFYADSAHGDIPVIDAMREVRGR